MPVLLIGPSGLSKEGLQQVLKAYGFSVVDGSPTLGGVKPSVAKKARLVVITEPAKEPDLARVVATLRSGDPDIRVVLLVDTRSCGAIEMALRIPAHAYLCQQIGCEPLMKALDVVLGDNAVMSSEVLSHLLSLLAEPEARPVSEIAARPVAVGTSRPLSDREVDILRCLTDGSSNKLIARRFDIAESTVKIHVKGILRKINVQNRTQAAIWALAHVAPVDALATDVAPAPRPAA